jgi:hypothetical protein
MVMGLYSVLVFQSNLQFKFYIGSYWNGYICGEHHLHMAVRCEVTDYLLALTGIITGGIMTLS